MHYFISAGEPSGDLHASHLISELKKRDPSATFSGLGGAKMQAAGCDLVYPLAENPVMGLVNAIKAVPHLLGVLKQTKQNWEAHRPEAVVMIDYPGFHWHLAKAAKQAGIPVIYYVPPQIWGWGSWRVAKVRKYVDLVLCSLPFEPAWYHERGVKNALYVGHPFFDDLAERSLNQQFVMERNAESATQIALLPGSRTYEVEHNGPTLVKVAELLASRHSNLHFHVASFRQDHAAMMRTHASQSKAVISVHCKRTPEILATADLAISVSGSVSMELMYYGVPTAIIFRISRFMNHVLKPLLLKSKHITLVNLIADRRLFPEFVGSEDASAEIAAVVDRWLNNPEEPASIRTELARLRELYGDSGATRNAADQILNWITPQKRIAVAA